MVNVRIHHGVPEYELMSTKSIQLTISSWLMFVKVERAGRGLGCACVSENVESWKEGVSIDNREGMTVTCTVRIRIIYIRAHACTFEASMPMPRTRKFEVMANLVKSAVCFIITEPDCSE